MTRQTNANKAERIEELLEKESLAGATQEEEELQNFTERFATPGFMIAIYRMDPRTNRIAWLTKVLPAEATHEMIQQEFGGGKYQLRVLNSNGRYVTSQTIEIEALAKQKETPSVSTGMSPARGVDGQVEILQQQLARNQELLLAILAGNHNSNNSEKATLGEIAQVVTSLHAMVPQAASSGDPAVILNALTKGIEIATGQNKGNEKPAWYEIAKDVIAAVPQVLQTIRANNSNGEVPVTSAPIAPADEMKSKLEYLKRKCLLGKSPEIICDFILDNADEDERVMLGAFIAQGKDQLFALDSALKTEPYNTWFGILFEGLRDGLFGQDNSERIHGNEGDSGSDGTGSKVGSS